MPALSPAAVKAQTRRLWAECFGDTDAFMDIYFSAKYTDRANLRRLEGGRVTAAAQLLPYRMNLFGEAVRVGYVSGLCTRPGLRGKGYATQILREAHRRLRDEGAVLSFLIPGEPGLRDFYGQPRHGAYRTVAYRREIPIRPGTDSDDALRLAEAAEEEPDLYAFYRRSMACAPLTLLPSASDFRAAQAVCGTEGGCVLTARRETLLSGFCMVAREADGRCFVRELQTADPAARTALLRAAARTCGVEKLYRRIPVAATDLPAAPYAMARVVSVPRFLAAVVRAHPGLNMHLGIGGDLDLPENNGSYLLRDGRCTPTTVPPPEVLTPGALAARFLCPHPVGLPLMLDE